MPMTMNISSGRKQSMKSILAVMSLAVALVSPAYGAIDWGFPTAADSVTVTGPWGSATAQINAGLSSGWHDGSDVRVNWQPMLSLNGGHGLWDLGGGGTPGSIVLSSPAWGSGLTTLNVFQWVDPGLYNGGELTVKVGSTLAALVGNGSLVGSTTGYGAGWWEYTYNLGAALTGTDTVTITAGSGGAILDHLTLVPEPATMIAGAVLLIPFALSTWPILRRRRTS